MTSPEPFPSPKPVGVLYEHPEWFTPLFDELGRAVAAVSISGPSARIPVERLPILGRMVAQAALEATRDYGGTVPFAAQ